MSTFQMLRQLGRYKPVHVEVHPVRETLDLLYEMDKLESWQHLPIWWSFPRCIENFLIETYIREREYFEEESTGYYNKMIRMRTFT